MVIEQKSTPTEPGLQTRRRDDYEGKHAAKTVLRGTVRDASDHSGLAGTSVSIKNAQLGVGTDMEGNFVLEVPAEYVKNGTVTLLFHNVGYDM